MTYVTRENITDQVLEVFERTPDPRLREVMQSLVKHLHAFIREVEPSDEEFEMGCKFVVGLGQNTSEKKNEAILASDILGASTLITLINNVKRAESAGKYQTESALLGPFWRKNAPIYEPGSNLAYAASKAGVDVLTKGLAKALAPQVRVIAVSPGVVDSSFVPGRGADFNDKAAATIPLKRIGHVDDTAATIEACATTLRFATGSRFVVDGGRSL